MSTPAAPDKWPSRYIDPVREATDGLGRIARRAQDFAHLADVTTRNAELAENCRALTGLCQQLVDALDASHDTRAAIAALDAAAELGITPKAQS